LPWNGVCAQHYADVRASLKRRRRSIGNLDLMIAGHSRAEGLILVTSNQRHFCNVPQLWVETVCAGELTAVGA
jgi:tRNA(fMet)-specific endonuclease VapC